MFRLLKAFKGDQQYNPEDMLLSSVVSCHMMSYLYVCEQNGIEVLSYTDSAEATLQIFRTVADALSKFVCIKSGHKTKRKNSRSATLTPKNKLCFIANSCNFPIVHEPSCEIR
jgi:organic hydroperoxide reductase OsmC/OhrA